MEVNVVSAWLLGGLAYRIYRFFAVYADDDRALRLFDGFKDEGEDRLCGQKVFARVWEVGELDRVLD